MDSARVRLDVQHRQSYKIFSKSILQCGYGIRSKSSLEHGFQHI